MNSALLGGTGVHYGRTQIANAIKDDPLVDSARWKASVSALLADLPKLQKNARLMMSGLIPE